MDPYKDMAFNTHGERRAIETALIKCLISQGLTASEAFEYVEDIAIEHRRRAHGRC